MRVETSAMFASLPLLGLPVLFYNLFVMGALPGGLQTTQAGQKLALPLFTLHMSSGADWTVTYSDLMVFASLIILFIELLKSTNSGRVAIINHSLSMLLFIVCLVEFLLLRGMATSAFVLITAMVLLDVLAGFIVSIIAARREVDFHG